MVSGRERRVLPMPAPRPARAGLQVHSRSKWEIRETCFQTWRRGQRQTNSKNCRCVGAHKARRLYESHTNADCCFANRNRWIEQQKSCTWTTRKTSRTCTTIQMRITRLMVVHHSRAERTRHTPFRFSRVPGAARSSGAHECENVRMSTCQGVQTTDSHKPVGRSIESAM